MISCKQCGIENRETARFCLNCGAKLELPVTPEEPTLPPVEENSVTEFPVQEESSSPDQPAATETLVESEPAVAEPAPEPTPPAAESAEAEPIEFTEIPISEAEPEEAEEAEEVEAGDLQAAEEPTDGPEIAPAETEESLPSTHEPAAESEDEPVILPKAAPLEPGTVLAGRYELVQVLQETDATILYDAVDRGRCPQCGFGESEVGDVFCANCGASLIENGDMPHVHLRALRLQGEAVIQLEEETNGQVELWFEDSGRLYAVLPIISETPEERPVETPFGQGVRHIVGYGSDAGRQRELDEDAVLVLTLAPLFESQSQPSLGLYAVADGMGGHEGGEVASRLAIEQLSETLAKRLLLPELTGEPVLPGTPAALMTEAVQAINSTIYNIQQNTGSDMGTTLTAALVRDGRALIANVGDSRTYLWRQSELRQLTQDHSLVAQLVEAGAIEPHEIYTHPDKSAIYRSLGHYPETEVDLFEEQLQPGDRLLLCCDGVWEMLHDEGIEEVLLLEADPQRACDEIVRRSNLAGGEDNISVIIVQFESLGQKSV